MQLQRSIEQATIKQLVIASAILALLVLAYLNKELILSKFHSDVP